MSSSQSTPELVGEPTPKHGKGRTAVAFRRFRSHKVGVAGAAVVVMMILIAVIGPLLWTYQYGETTPNLSQTPSLQHPMGTDTLGRDMLAQVLRGLQQSLLIAFSVTAIACLIGVILGVVSGYFGSFVDATVMRMVDLTLTLPTIAIAAFLGSVISAGGVSWVSLALVLGVLMWTSVARLVRGVVLSLRELAYVDAARVMGAGHARIMFRHLVPNVADHIIIAATIMFSTAILLETGLSFLGFGVQPPDTSLGLLVSNAQSAVLTRPWLFYFPGLLIVLLVLAMNYTGEGIRDSLNPKSSPINPLESRRWKSCERAEALPADQDNLIVASNLQVSFDGLPAVDDVDLKVAPGEVLALVGESGSGKTLSALSLVGLLPSNAIASGSIRFNDEEISEFTFNQWRKYRGQRVAMILQDPSTTLNPVLTIGSQFADSLRMVGVTGTEARDRAADVLASVSIKAPRTMLDQFPHQLSGGMRQRVAIAMAIMHDPDLIIADEPTTALDVTVQAQIMATLAIARERTGAAMLFITHDLALVAGIADRVAVMHRGRIVEEKDVFSMFSDPQEDYTKKLLAIAPHIDVFRSQ